MSQNAAGARQNGSDRGHIKGGLTDALVCWQGCCTKINLVQLESVWTSMKVFYEKSSLAKMDEMLTKISGAKLFSKLAQTVDFGRSHFPKTQHC